MAYYRGTFRSLDQSVDPKGQRYDVLIFTGYDASALNTVTIGRVNSINLGPYPYKSIWVGSGTTSGGVAQMVYANVPVKASNLTMTDHPFVVNYAGDGLEKPYRCSSATVSFLQSTLNTDFINSLGQNVLVFLLKWRNTIVEVNGHLEDTETGAGLYKHKHQYTSSGGPSVDPTYVYWNDYYPWEYDNFCFDVEWAGFSTPAMLNTEYSHSVDKFSIECQDAFSTLQYIKFERTDQMETMLETLLRALQTLGIYRKVYITNDVHFAPATNDLESTTTVSGTALRYMAHQQDNCYDEDGNPMDYRKLLENMMNYLGLTIIPEGDSLYIVNDHCIGDGHTDYKLFKFSNVTQNRCWSLPAENPTYDNGADVNVVSTRVLGKDDFCGGSTQLSSDVMYNKAVVTCDEMRPDPLTPDINDVNNFYPEPANSDQPFAVHRWRVTGDAVHGWSVDPDSYSYMEAYFYRCAIEEIKFWRYVSTSATSAGDARYNWSYPAQEITDADLKVDHHVQYAGANDLAFVPDWLEGVNKAPSTDRGSDSGPLSNMGMMCEWGSVKASSATDVPTSLTLNRCILLATPLNFNNRYTGPNGSQPHNWDDKSQFWNPMMYIKSKPFLGNGKQYLNINGTFKFHGNSSRSVYAWWPTENTGGSYFKFNTNNNFVHCMIKMGSYYLTSSSRGQYIWYNDGQPHYCKMWFDDRGLSGGADYIGTEFPFETVIRGIEGITVELPVIEGYAEPLQVEIWIDRPIGPGTADSFTPQSTEIKNLEINVFSKTYVESRKRREPDKDNTTYENVITAGAIEEGPTTDLIHSSTDEAGLSYSETVKQTIRRRSAGTKVYRTNPEVMNDGTGYYGIPEQNNINGKCNQYKTPTLQVSTEFFRKDTQMHTRVLWPTQLSGHNFIINSMEIDYEYEQSRAELIEAKAPATPVASGVISPQVPVNRVNQTRNYHRTMDIMFDGHIARRNPVALSISTVTGNEVDDSQAPQYTIDTDNPIDGASRFNMDFATGRIRLTTPVGSTVTASMNNNQVRVTTN